MKRDGQNTSVFELIVYVIGIILIVGNSYGLITGYLLPKQNPWSIPMTVVFLERYLDNVSLFPVGLSALIALFMKGSGVWSVYAVTGIWQLAVLLCGLGLVAFKNVAREAVIAVCWLRLAVCLISWPVTAVLYKQMAGRSFTLSWGDGVAVLIPLIYIVLLMNPGVKKVFK